MRPRSATSQTKASGSCHTADLPVPPPWRMLFAASSLAASTTSLRRRQLIPAQRPRPRRRSCRTALSRVRSKLNSSTSPSGRRQAAGEGRVAEKERRSCRTRSSSASSQTQGWLRCAAASTSRREPTSVIGTEEGELAGTDEGEVEQRLVVIALLELLGAAPRPRRLADTALGPLAGIGDELAPGRDDAAGLRPSGPISTNCTARRGCRAPAQEREVAPAERDHHRLARRRRRRR